jgi:predicted DNA-binding protein
MLGIRLERQLEARLEALTERSGKPKFPISPNL